MFATGGLGGVHRGMKAAEMAGADGAPAEQRRRLELDLGGECERALGADQNMREVEIVAAGRERIEVVAADPALHLWKSVRDLGSLALAQRQHVPEQVRPGFVTRDLAEVQQVAIGQRRLDR